MFEIIKPGTTIDFVGKRHLWLTFSTIALIGSIILFFTKGLNYGIDFTGGAEIQIQVPESWDTGKIRSELKDGGIKDARIQEIEEQNPAVRQFLIKAQGEESEINQISKQVETALAKSLKPGEFEIQRADVVGPAAGSSLRMSGFLSMFYALLCILVYVTVRFDMRYAPGAVLALFHDSVITIGVFVLTQKQFDLQILAAILALIGYSNNDTIIVYDRVRETLTLHPELKIEQAVNRAVNETLGRTFLTAFSTLLSVLALWIFGGSVIHDFAFALMVGMIVGTYSSIFVASSVVIYLTRYQEKRAKNAKTQSGGKRTVNVRPEPKLQG